MRKDIPAVEEVRKQFEQQFDCSQVVAEHFAKDMGLSVEEARKLTACYGGGCAMGGTCGAVSGAMMVLGAKYGQYDEAHMEQKEVMAQKRAAFFDAFREAYGSPLCRDLLQFDLSKPDEREQAVSSGIMMDLCPRIVHDTIRMTEKLLDE